MSFRACALLGAVLFGLAGAGRAVQDPKAPPDKKELDAQNAVAAELVRLAGFCAGKKAYAAARAECERGLRHFPSTKLQDEIKKHAGKKDAPPKTFAKDFEAERKKSHEKCAMLLADLAAACSKQGRTEAFERYLRAIHQDFPSEKALAKLDVAWFEPYRKWVSRDDAKKLEAGWERVDEKWMDPAAVAGLNRKHASWDDPWIETDGIHELRTTVALRDARRLLAYVGAYRAFFLREFAGAWDLKPPSGRLPVILTETQEALQAQMRKYAGAISTSLPGGIQGAAYYMITNSTLNPCFVTLEPTDAAGRAMKVTVDDVWRALTHEVTHQIAAEYSKHDFDNTRLVRHHFWAIESIATFMQNHVLEKGEWRLRPLKMVPLKGGLFEQGAFTWCVENADRLPPLSRFMAQTQAEYVTVENYSIGATLAYFFLHGEEGAYRASYVKLLERVHKVRDTEHLFVECFEGIDLKGVDERFRKFAGQVKLE